MKTYNTYIDLWSDVCKIIATRPDIQEYRDRIVRSIEALFEVGNLTHVYTLKAHPKYFNKDDTMFGVNHEHHLMGILFPVGMSSIIYGNNTYTFQLVFNAGKYVAPTAPLNYPFLTISLGTKADNNDIVAQWEKRPLYDILDQVTL